jgi:hypothetical protein
MKKKGTPKQARSLSLDNVVSEGEATAARGKAWEEVFGKGRKDGSIHHFSFLAHKYLGERRLEKLGQLDLFRKTQQLPDYIEAENAVRSGWKYFNKVSYGVGEDEGSDKLKIRQCILLYELRSVSPTERQSCLERAGAVCLASAKRGDADFFVRLGRALSQVSDDGPNQEGPHEFAQLLLTHWLTSFLWLMPLKAAASFLAKIQGVANDQTEVDRINVRIRQATSRLPWRPYFYSRRQPLIDCIEDDGSPILTAAGKRLLTD